MTGLTRTDGRSQLANQSQRSSPSSKRLLAALTAAALLSLSIANAEAREFENYAERTPGAHFLKFAEKACRAGQVGTAMENFLAAAHWADKVAQYNVGAMYYLGQGVPENQVRAWAWFALASERGYPHMVEIRDALWARLEEGDQARARTILDQELLPAYGDAVAIERTSRRMDRGLRRSTGSRVGNSAFLRVIEADGPWFFNPHTQQLTGSGTHTPGWQFYDRRKWNFETVMRAKSILFDAAAVGQVTFGELRLIDTPTE